MVSNPAKNVMIMTSGNRVHYTSRITKADVIFGAEDIARTGGHPYRTSSEIAMPIDANSTHKYRKTNGTAMISKSPPFVFRTWSDGSAIVMSPFSLGLGF